MDWRRSSQPPPAFVLRTSAPPRDAEQNHDDCPTAGCGRAVRLLVTATDFRSGAGRGSGRSAGLRRPGKRSAANGLRHAWTSRDGLLRRRAARPLASARATLPGRRPLPVLPVPLAPALPRPWSAAVVLPIAGIAGAWGVSKIKKTKKERAIKGAMAECMSEGGYSVDKWRVMSKREVRAIAAETPPATAKP